MEGRSSAAGHKGRRKVGKPSSVSGKVGMGRVHAGEVYRNGKVLKHGRMKECSLPKEEPKPTKPSNQPTTTSTERLPQLGSVRCKVFMVGVGGGGVRKVGRHAENEQLATARKIKKKRHRRLRQAEQARACQESRLSPAPV